LDKRPACKFHTIIFLYEFKNIIEEISFQDIPKITPNGFFCPDLFYATRNQACSFGYVPTGNTKLIHQCPQKRELILTYGNQANEYPYFRGKHAVE